MFVLILESQLKGVMKGKDHQLEVSVSQRVSVNRELNVANKTYLMTDANGSARHVRLTNVPSCVYHISDRKLRSAGRLLLYS